MSSTTTSLQTLWNGKSLWIWTLPANVSQAQDAAASIAQLRDHLGEITPDALLASVASESSLTLKLPVNGRLEERTIPALQFPPAEGIDLLASLPDPVEECCADSTRFWAKLARFVLGRVRQMQFFPALRSNDGMMRGAWQLMLSGRDEVERMQKFAAAMPLVCRASANGEANSAPLALVESFIAETTDALVRRAVISDPDFQAIHELAAAPNSEPPVRWLSALMSPESSVKNGDPRGNAMLAEQINLWIGNLDDRETTNLWQLAFELHEPDEDYDAPTIEPAESLKWRVTFALHPQDESAEPIEAERIWLEGATALGELGRNIAERRELFLSELTRASEIFPPLQNVVRTPTPTYVDLTTGEAHLFLRHWGEQLRSMSFKVIVPDWAADRERRLGLVVSLRPTDFVDDDELLDLPNTRRRQNGTHMNGGRMGLDSLLDFNWRVAVGDTQLSGDEFDHLLRQQSPLIKLRGRWVDVDLEAARAASEFLKEKSSGQMTLREAFQTAYGLGSRKLPVPVVSLSGTSWIEQLIEQLPAARVQTLEQPLQFNGTLRPYQLRGLQWLNFLDHLGIGGCLADDMGLGKTIQLIALLLHERQQRENGQENGKKGDSHHFLGTTLLFAPTSVVGNWVKELERFSPQLKVWLHHGPQRLHGAAFTKAAQENDVVVTSYALAHRDLEDLIKVKWHRIALDEAQKIKNPSAASSIAIRSLVAPHRVALTGTPIENHLSELWSIMDMLNPGLLGSPRDFRERFAVPIEKLSDQERAGHLRKMIRPFVLRRSKSDPEVAGDLPEKMEMKVFCNLTAEQAAMYERITGEMLGQIDQASGIRRRGLILAVLTRLKQICNHPALLTKDDVLEGRSGKCERLVEMLEEVIEEGESALVFTQFSEMGMLLERILHQRLHQPILYLHGGTPQKQRDEMVARFQDPKGDAKIFLLSLRAGGLGLNLTAANHVFHFDRWWNPAVENQATDRAHRIGQNKKVQVHKFVALGTVEE
ncbi:MAG TPA: DEAD/DEAH box helicase, partial [Tepidisphaeraceae bacterium]|nr:DEAD/DEAH box helicase [Tepidisphaeraceae bacterium]